MNKPLIVANWKMKGKKELYSQIVEKLIQNQDLLQHCRVVIFPPSIYLSWLSDMTQNLALEVGSQDVSRFLPGAYTGEVSAEMLRDLGVKWSLLGHSERRQWAYEDEPSVANKLLRCTEQGIHPVVCVGETAEQREKNLQFEVIQQQVEGSLSLLDKNQILNCHWAYEPVWAIGSGRVADAQNIADMARFVHSLLNKFVSHTPQILYGGSVDAKITQEVLNIPFISGLLVGSTSLNPLEWLTILQQVGEFERSLVKH